MNALEQVLTERLQCERLRPEHAAELAALLQDPRVARTTWPRPDPPTLAEVEEGVRLQEVHWERYGFGLWLLRDRDTRAMVGRGGLEHTHVEGERAVEIAWAIVPERWGQGLATELALASVAIGFDQLAVDELIVLTLVDNHASRRVADKAGFRYKRDVIHAGLPHALYTRGPV